MSSRSFGEWYEKQKKDPIFQPSSTSSSSWVSSFLGRKESDNGDVESVGLLSKTKNVGKRISQAGETMKDVMIFFGLAILFFVIAYVIGLPVLLLRPAKFTISFTMGSFMTILALAKLQGTANFFNSVFQQERLLKTSLYLISLLLSILCAVVWKSYMGTVLSSIFQMIMLVLFVMESFPAGSYLTSLLCTGIKKFFSMIMSIISRFIRYLFLLQTI